MIHTIRVAPKQVKKNSDGFFVTRVYRLEGATMKQARFLADSLFCESITHRYSLNRPLPIHTQKAEIAYKSGVMNPEAASILEAARDLRVRLLAADSSREYHFPRSFSQKKVEKTIMSLQLLNPTIEQIVKKSPKTLLMKGAVGKTLIIPLRSMSDDQLQELSKDKLFLNLQEMHVIQDYFKKARRDPTDGELETLAQTWSEHCAHKTFKANLLIDGRKKDPLIKRIQKEALKHNTHIVSAFVDNSGVMDFYEGQAICGKVETHNSPSAIEPYGGAMTGSGGVFRDVLGTGLGAKTIASTDIFCFAHPNLSARLLPDGCLPPEYLLKRVVAGVRDYGNRMGIPTNNGSVHFHNDFRAKPTIIVGAYGLIPKKKAKKRVPKVGDHVIAVGGRTGRDGIHGATFSSAEMTDKTVSVNSSAVQIGNAIEEKRMFDAILEARDNDCIRATQDCGAGGFSSAIGEMGESTGVTVHLEKAPLKYQGLAPWEIWVSESQERMILAVPKNKLKKFTAICNKYNVEMADLGTFDGTKTLRVFYGKESVVKLSMDFLHHGLPQRTMTAKNPRMKARTAHYSIPKKNEWQRVLKKILSHGNICSKEPIVRLYDHTVQGGSVLQPYAGERMDGPNDATVIKPLLNKNYGMVLSHGLNPTLNNLDPYKGAVWAIIEALANYVAVGGNYKEASLINNYIWPVPDEESLWSLDQAVDAVVDAMKIFKIPVISGKDSLSSTYRSGGMILKIPPVLCMSVFGRIPDVRKTISSDLKKEGSHLYLVGSPDVNSMGASVYLDVQKKEGGAAPIIDMRKTAQTFTTIHNAIKTNSVLSVHDVSEGGVATALFEMASGGRKGVLISVPKRVRSDNFLFNETAGSFVVEVADKKTAARVFKNAPYLYLGTTTEEERMTVSQNNKTLFDIPIQTLRNSWEAPMRKIFS